MAAQIDMDKCTMCGGYTSTLCVEVCPDQAISKDPMTQRPVIDLQYCKGCGLCAHLCPKGAITMILEQQIE